jgi:hypothetical protein
MSQIVEAFIRWYSGAARYDPLATHRHWPPMTAALALLYNSAIIIVGAFLFVAVDWFEPNRLLALVFKCAILAAGGVAIAKHLLH